MFGNKKNKILEEQNRAWLAQMVEKKEGFDADVAQLEEAQKRICSDICQVIENSQQLVEHASFNIEEESKMIHSIDDFSKDMKTAADEYEKLRLMVEKQLEAVTTLVEENKHYTSPAKYLTEATSLMRAANLDCVEKLSEMEEEGRKIGVMALNAAIEAGRMGEDGKQFVVSSEEIRQTAMSFEKKAALLREKLDSSKERIEELEEVVGRLVTLMKENNMGTTRLLKKCHESSKAMEESAMRDFSKDMILIKDKVVGLRNLDEEIVKCSERNKIQLCDVQEEASSQKEQLAELESDISYMFDVLEERSC